MKLVTVIGARPQFIKAATVSKKIREKCIECIVHTGQHYDDNMSKIFFEELSIPFPDYILNIGSGNHGAQTGRMLEKVENILLNEKPDYVLVYGDTNSTLAGALAASKLLIPVVHIEAGLRSFNKSMPEEQNRILTDHISKYAFAPTDTAVQNLFNEGIKENVFNVGDVMFDAVIYFKNLAKQKSTILQKYALDKEDYILTTIHRAENTNSIERLKSIFEGLNESGQNIVLPLHPRTKKYIKNYSLRLANNIKIIDPVGYLDMIMLEANSKKIVTDSGGVQKEAFFLSKPCITLRDETEWIETVENGWNIIAGADKDKIRECILEFVPKQAKKKYFGDGNAVEKIINELF